MIEQQNISHQPVLSEAENLKRVGEDLLAGSKRLKTSAGSAKALIVPQASAPKPKAKPKAKKAPGGATKARKPRSKAEG